MQQRLFKNSKKNFLGFVVIVLLMLFIFSFWNDTHNYKIALSIKQAQNILVSIPTKPINRVNESKVVYVKGKMTTMQTLRDSELNLNINAIKLIRTVRMYQWIQTIKTGIRDPQKGSKKVYKYEKVWSENLIDSTNFKEAKIHQNPSNMPMKSQIQLASEVTLGDFILSKALLDNISFSKKITLDDKIISQLNKVFSGKTTVYAYENSQAQIGDLVIELQIVYPQPVSIIAQQIGRVLQAYAAPAGYHVSIIAKGQIAPSDLIQIELEKNKSPTWFYSVKRTLSSMIRFFNWNRFDTF